jgi:hypothetical protein
MHSTFSGRAPAACSSLPDQLQHSTPRPTPLLRAPRRRRRPGPRPGRSSSRRREHRSPKGLAPRNRHQARQHRKRGPGRTQPAGCRRFRLSASATPAPPHTHTRAGPTTPPPTTTPRRCRRRLRRLQRHWSVATRRPPPRARHSSLAAGRCCTRRGRAACGLRLSPRPAGPGCWGRRSWPRTGSISSSTGGRALPRPPGSPPTGRRPASSRRRRGWGVLPSAGGAARAPAEPCAWGRPFHCFYAAPRAPTPLSRYAPVLAGSAVGRRGRGSSASNVQVIDVPAGTIDNIVRWVDGQLSAGERGPSVCAPACMTGTPRRRPTALDGRLPKARRPALGPRPGSVAASRGALLASIDTSGRLLLRHVYRFKVAGVDAELRVSGRAFLPDPLDTSRRGGAAFAGNSVLGVTFERFVVRAAGRQLALPLDWLSPVGYVDTLFLDEEASGRGRCWTTARDTGSWAAAGGWERGRTRACPARAAAA